jgi:ATP-dependent helicase HrpB
MASGAGAVVAPQSGVVGGEFLAALDLHASQRDDPDARIRIASIVDREWLIPTRIETVHVFDEARGVVRAFERDRFDALVLAERAIPVNAETAAAMLSDAWQKRGPDEDDRRLLQRATFAGCALDVPAIVRAAASVAHALDEVRLRSALPVTVRARLDRDAPESLRLPSGRTIRLEYGEGGVSAAVKLQDLFGVSETPRIGPNRERLLLALLAPNGRPVQVTRDLESFWKRTYPEVRKELRGRYPKHKWPEVPTAALR